MPDTVGVVAESWQVVRRPRRLTAAPTLVASGAPADPAKIKTAAGLGGFASTRKSWQDEAWDFYDKVPEFQFYVNWVADACSKVAFVASEIGEDGQPTRSVPDNDAEAQKFAGMVEAIAGGVLGQSQMLKRLAEVLKIAGEAWLAIIKTVDKATGKKVDRWVALSQDQIATDATGKTVLTLVDETKHDFDTENEGIFRIWHSHPRKPWLADSAVRSCLDPLREIAVTTAAIRNAAQSRLINGGLLVLPDELNLPTAASGPAPAGMKEATKPPIGTQLQNLLVATMKEAVKDPISPPSLVPITATGRGEYLKEIRHISIGKDILAEHLETREKGVVRLARGLQVSQERILGIGDTNHWNLWGITDQDVQMHIAPEVKLICEPIYELILKPMLVSEGINPDRFTLWFDVSRLTVDPDKTDEAQNAYQGGAITAEALVRHTGLSEEDLYDLDSDEGRRVWARDTLKRHPELFDKLAALADFPQPEPAQAPVLAPAPAPVLPAGQEPGTETQTRAVAASAVTWWTNRALELAGRRRVDTRDKDQFALLRDVPPHRYHLVLGPVSAGDVARLIRGWDATLDDGDVSRLGLSAEHLRAEVQRLATRELTAIDGQVI